MRELRCSSLLEKKSTTSNTPPKKAKPGALLVVYKHCHALEGNFYIKQFLYIILD